MVAKETKDKDNKELYGAEYVWKRNGADHFCHALLYAIVGLQRYGGEKARIVGNDIIGVPRPRLQNVMPDQQVQGFVRGDKVEI